MRGDLQIALMTETCRLVRLYLPNDPRTPDEREDDSNAQLFDAVIDGCSGRFGKSRPLYFTALHPPHMHSGKVLRGIFAKMLVDQKGDPRVHMAPGVSEDVWRALDALDDWLDTPVVDRLAKLA